MPITSSTTCMDVIAYIKSDLKLNGCRNGFGLFETCGTLTKYLEEKVCKVVFFLEYGDMFNTFVSNKDGCNLVCPFYFFLYVYIYIYII